MIIWPSQTYGSVKYLVWARVKSPGYLPSLALLGGLLAASSRTAQSNSRMGASQIYTSKTCYLPSLALLGGLLAASSRTARRPAAATRAEVA